MKKQLTVLAIIFANILLGFSQQVPIKGVVSSASGPLLGANVLVKGTSNGTSADFDGNYTINAKVGSTLVFSFVGYKTQEIKVGNKTTINVLLEEDNSLEEVTLTYHGVRKEQKALGFGVAKVSSEEIVNQAEVDVANTLQGKVSGLQITQASGATGAETEVIIRSALSITNESGGNGALIILNDVPFAGSLIEIDPNDIKDITVLKGLSATILYGTDGRNGVIIIETFSGTPQPGEHKLNVKVSRTDYINTVSNLPVYQNKYGAGRYREYRLDTKDSWGPAFSVLDEVPSPVAEYPSVFPDLALNKVPYVAAPNNVTDIFNIGLGSLTSVALSSSQEKTSFSLSMAYASEEGVMGVNDLQRFNIGTGGVMHFGDKFKFSLNLNLSNRKTRGQSGSEIFRRLLYLPRNIDLNSFPYENPVTHESVFYSRYSYANNNPLWVIENSLRKSDVVRTSGNFKVDFVANEHISANYRVGVDIDVRDAFNYSNKGGVTGDYRFGFLNLGYDKNVELDQRFIINADYDLSEKIGFSGLVGMHSRISSSRGSDTRNTNQIAYGFFRPSNFTEVRASYGSSKRNILGVYSQLIFDYNDYMYLTLSGRNDWASTLEKENRSNFYPGVSLSFIPSKAFRINKKYVSFLKFRASYAESLGFPRPYRTRNRFSIDPEAFSTSTGNIVTNSESSNLPNLALKAELHREYELGIEGKLFGNFIDFESSLYFRNSFDQLTSISLDPSTGYQGTLTNLGQVDTKGFETDLTFNFINTKNFSWSARNTFTAYKTEVVKLKQSEIEIGGGRFAIVGQPLGVVKGDYALKDKQGNFLINPADGNIIQSSQVNYPSVLPDKIIADPTPEWFVSTIQKIKYKGFSFSAQLEYSKGGTDYSTYAVSLLESGVTRDTENRDGSFVLNGVMGDVNTGLPILDENNQTIPNTIQVPLSEIYIGNYYAPRDNGVFDLSVFRIRELTFGYDFSKKLLKTMPFESLSFKLNARNVFYKAPYFPKYTNIDPGISSSRYSTYPSTKRFALSILASF